MMETLLDISGKLPRTDIGIMKWSKGYLFQQFWENPYKTRARHRCFCGFPK